MLEKLRQLNVLVAFLKCSIIYQLPWVWFNHYALLTDIKSYFTHIIIGYDNFAHDIDDDLLSYAEQEYGYFYNFIVDEDYRSYATAVCEGLQLQYPPENYEDALLLYFILTDDSDTI